jgi:hypothetical protein
MTVPPLQIFLILVLKFTDPERKLKRWRFHSFILVSPKCFHSFITKKKKTHEQARAGRSYKTIRQLVP